MTCIYISVATGYRINKILVCFTACDTSHWEGLVEQQFGWISCKTKPSIYARLYTRSYNKRSQKRPAYLQLINNSNTYILFHVPRNSCSGLTWSHHLKRVHVNRWYGLVLFEIDHVASMMNRYWVNWISTSIRGQQRSSKTVRRIAKGFIQWTLCGCVILYIRISYDTVTFISI